MCRRVGAPVCGRPNCPSNKRPYPPGLHGRGRKRLTEYQMRLVEKQKLRAIYGVPLMKPHGHPIAELILTVLSQSTNDRNRDVAYLRLRQRFPSWEQVRTPRERALHPGASGPDHRNP